MASQFRFLHRVEFSETDMAGIVHFSNFFRYMEKAEHAFFRSLGYSVHPRKSGEFQAVGWPRVHAECDYLGPITFEDEVEILLYVARKGKKSLTYFFEISRILQDGKQLCARGKTVAACVTLSPEAGKMVAVDIPDYLTSQISEADPVLFTPKS